MPPNEARVRDWIAAHLQDIPGSILGFEDAIASLERQQSVTAAEVENASIFSLLHMAVNRIVAKRTLLALKALRSGGELIPLGTEFPLIAPEGPGRGPSADILSVFAESAAYAIIEVKISASTAREAVTELSAYAQGLNDRYFSLSALDSIWIIISTDYRVTLKEAVAHQLLFAGRSIVPLRANVESNGDDVASVRFEVVDVGGFIPRYTTDSLLHADNFDILEVYSNRLIQPMDVLQHHITATFSKNGSSGLSFQVTPSDYAKREMMYPYGIVTVHFNPFKAYLKSREMRYYLEEAYFTLDSQNYFSALHESCGDYFDVDLRKGFSTVIKGRDENGWPISPRTGDIRPFSDYSLNELSLRTLNSTHFAFEELMADINGLPGIDTAVGAPSFRGALLVEKGINATHYDEDNMSNVRYFGFMHELMLKLGCLMGLRDADHGPSNVLDNYGSPAFFLYVIREVNSIET